MGGTTTAISSRSPGSGGAGFDAAVAAQQAGAKRFVAEIRKTRGHHAG